MLRKRTSPASRSTPTSEARPCELLFTILRDRSVPVLRPHAGRPSGEVRRKAAARVPAAPAAGAAHLLASAQGAVAVAPRPRLRPDAHPYSVVLQDRLRFLHRSPRPGDHQPGRRHRAELQYQHRGDDRHDPRGPPRIGDRVWIGTNAVIVGGIEIGDDVLIAPGAFVNVDVPSGSTVIGNPGVVHLDHPCPSEYVQNPWEGPEP